MMSNEWLSGLKRIFKKGAGMHQWYVLNQEENHGLEVTIASHGLEPLSHQPNTLV